MIEIKDDYLGKDTIMKGVDEGLEAVQTHGAAFISILWMAIKGVFKYYEDTVKLITKYPHVIKKIISVWVDALNGGIKESIMILNTEKEFLNDCKEMINSLEKNDKVLQRMIDAIDSSSLHTKATKYSKTKFEEEYDALADLQYKAAKKYDELKASYFSHLDDEVTLEEVAQAKIEFDAAEKACTVAWEKLHDARMAQDKEIKEFILKNEPKPQEEKKQKKACSV